MSGDLKDMRAYSRGYEDGRRSKDADDHAAVAIRLSRLTFDGNHHGNLSKIAHAIYPCATGWTCESSKGLRDRLIDLLGGVHEHHHRCGTGRDCACGDSRARGVGEHAEAMTCDVLGNERHKAVCELRKLSKRNPLAYGFRDALAAAIDIPRDDAPYDDKELCHLICDRLIYLLGGDQPTLSDLYGILQDGAESENKGAESVSEMTKNAEIGELDGDGTSPNGVGTCPNDSPTSSITDELRDYLGENGQEYDNYKGEMIGSISGGLSPIYAIANRIDEQFASVCEQRDLARSEVIELRDGYYKLQRKLYEIEDLLDG